MTRITLDVTVKSVTGAHGGPNGRYGDLVIMEDGVGTRYWYWTRGGGHALSLMARGDRLTITARRKGTLDHYIVLSHIRVLKDTQ